MKAAMEQQQAQQQEYAAQTALAQQEEQKQGMMQDKQIQLSEAQKDRDVKKEGNVLNAVAKMASPETQGAKGASPI